MSTTTGPARARPGGRAAGDLQQRIAAARAAGAPSKVAYPVGIRALHVLRRERLSAGLVRLVLGGEELSGFQSHVPEEHVRLLFPDPDGELRLPVPEGDVLRWPRPLPTSREYTVRHHDPVAGELHVDLAVHPGGLASGWALRVEPGARVHVAGPPGGLVLPDRYEHHLFAGDLSAQPQIARYLRALPAHARGWALVEVADAAEQVPMPAPAGVQVRWVHRGTAPAGTGTALADAVRAVPLPAAGRTLVWVAGEAGAVKPLRRWLRHGVGPGAVDHLVTGYWKRGVADHDPEHDETDEHTHDA